MWKAFTTWLSALFGARTGSGATQGSSTTTTLREWKEERSREANRAATAASPAATTSEGRTDGLGAAAKAADEGRATSSATSSPSSAKDTTKAPLPAPTAASNDTKGRYIEHSSRGDMTLEGKERELLARISQRISKGDLELPQLPSTSMAVIDMTGKASAEIKDIVRLIESDPVLSSEIVKTANSALYSGAEPVETIAQSVMRIGMRNLRSLMFSLSMRSAVLRDKRLSHYAEEVWRQSYSTASIARAIAKPLGQDPDRAFLLGLLSDIGKVSLLAMLRKEVPKGTEVSPALVGRVFYLYHELAGARLAEAWHMPIDFVACSGCHHRYEENKHNPKDAALISLALRLDIVLERGTNEELQAAVHAPEMDFLELEEPRRLEALEAAREAHSSQTPVG